jgi:hypothetical protein
MIFVKLTTLEDAEIFVNLERIDYMMRSVSDDGEPCTNIVTIIGEDDQDVWLIRVRQTPQEIFKMKREI